MPIRRAANPISHRLARLSFAMGVAAVVTVGAAGPLYRFERIDLGLVLVLFRWGAYCAFAAVALGIATAVAARPGEGRRGVVAAALGVALGIAAAWIPVQWMVAAQGLPSLMGATPRIEPLPLINDIATDPANPPPFVALLRARSGAATPPEHPGPRVAALQKLGYPDLAPLTLPTPPAEAFARVERAAAAMGWSVVEANAVEGRLEAVDATPWFGFKDDIVVRVRPTAAGARIDVRSKSRIGVGDLGANAQRIRRFLKRVEG